MKIEDEMPKIDLNTYKPEGLETYQDAQFDTMLPRSMDNGSFGQGKRAYLGADIVMPEEDGGN